MASKLCFRKLKVDFESVRNLHSLSYQMGCWEEPVQGEFIWGGLVWQRTSVKEEWDTGAVPEAGVRREWCRHTMWVCLEWRAWLGRWGVMGGELDGGLRAQEENFTLYVHFITNWSLFICSEAEPHQSFPLVNVNSTWPFPMIPENE